MLAATYAARLRSALRRDGPLVLLSRADARLTVLRGKLRAAAWARGFLIHPTTFPVSYDRLDADNDFTRAIAAVARLLASVRTAPGVRASLLESAIAVRPGAAEMFAVDSGVIYQPLPPQWSAYQSTWSIVVAVLAQRALLGARGALLGSR